MVTLLAWQVAVAPATAQEMEPRAYVSAPVGANTVLFSFARSLGDVSFDPSLPFEDVKADVRAGAVGYGHSFALFGRQAFVFGALPYAWGDVSGKVAEQRAATSRSGLGDAKFKFSILLRGGPALTPLEFMKSKRQTIVGITMAMTPPLGQYYPEKLINLGSNRWSFKPEIGISHPRGRWLFDAYAGIWLFTANHQFYPGAVVRGQSPIGTIQAHVSYSLTLRAWTAFDATWYAGGRTSSNGVPGASRQNNTKLGATISLPVGRRYSLRASYAGPVVTALGTGFNVISVAWQVSWLSGAVH